MEELPTSAYPGALRPKHLDETFLGRFSKDFDFLGYRVDPEGLTAAKATLGSSSNVPPGLTSKAGEPEGSARFGV